MKKIYYNKLIRDKIPEKIKKSGGDFKARKLKPKEFEKELIKKAGEEADGLRKKDPNRVIAVTTLGDDLLLLGRSMVAG